MRISGYGVDRFTLGYQINLSSVEKIEKKLLA